MSGKAKCPGGNGHAEEDAKSYADLVGRKFGVCCIAYECEDGHWHTASYA